MMVNESSVLGFLLMGSHFINTSSLAFVDNMNFDVDALMAHLKGGVPSRGG